MDPGELSFTEHDQPPPAWAGIVDRGLGDANDAAAPLHEVQRLAVFAHDAAGAVVGGAVGRIWGPGCELQQLWVQPARRRQGLGAELVRRFERRAAARGARHFYLETWSFQAPRLYASLGYRVVHHEASFPHGLVKYTMAHDAATDPATPEAVVRDYWQRMASNDFTSVGAVLAADFVLEWPQSRERIRGAERLARMNAEYPVQGRWRFTLQSLTAAAERVVTEVIVADDATSALALSFFTVAGGRITKLVEYWPEPYAARPQRAHLVEPMD